MDTNIIIVCSACAGFVLGALVVAVVYHFKFIQIKKEFKKELFETIYGAPQGKRYNLGDFIKF